MKGRCRPILIFSFSKCRRGRQFFSEAVEEWIGKRALLSNLKSFFSRCQIGCCCPTGIFFQQTLKRALLSNLHIFFSASVEEGAAFQSPRVDLKEGAVVQSQCFFFSRFWKGIAIQSWHFLSANVEEGNNFFRGCGRVDSKEDPAVQSWRFF